MKYRMGFGLTAMLAVVPSPVLAQETSSVATLTPATPWNVDYAGDSCFLLRKFGTGDAEIILRITRPLPDGPFEIVLAGSGVPELPPEIEVPVRLAPTGNSIRLSGLTGSLSSTTGHFIRLDAPPVFFANTERGSVLHLEHRRFTRSISLPNLTAAIARLAQCNGELLASWGIDLASLETLSRRAQPLADSQPWIRTRDYPIVPHIGDTSTILTIDPSGQVSQCRIAHASGSPELDTAACETLRRRARFEPALDAQGQAVESFYFLRVRWRYPDL